MQKRFPALNPGLLFGIAASLLLHGSLLGMKAFQRSAEARFDSGVVSVELTLLPSIASVAEVQPVPVEPEPPQETVETIVEPPEPVPAIIEPEAILPESVPEPPMPAVQESANAIEQDGSPEDDQGAYSEAQTRSQCKPVYPGMSRRRGEEGVVVLSVEVSATGQGSNIQIVQSSGHSRLDKAAIKALGNAQFMPAIQFGRPCASTLVHSFNFKLTNDQ